MIWRFEVPGRTVTFSTQFEGEILRDLIRKGLPKRTQLKCSSDNYCGSYWYGQSRNSNFFKPTITILITITWFDQPLPHKYSSWNWLTEYLTTPRILLAFPFQPILAQATSLAWSRDFHWTKKKSDGIVTSLLWLSLSFTLLCVHFIFLFRNISYIPFFCSLWMIYMITL
jgi:hypothetical protein